MEEKASLKLKHKVMLQRIDKLYDIYSLLNDASTTASTNGDGPVLVETDNQIKSLDIIKEQYNRMFDAVIETREYDKYKEIEDVIIDKLAKIEIELNQKIRVSAKNIETIFYSIIYHLTKSKAFLNYVEVERELCNIDKLKDLLKLYIPYISSTTFSEIQKQISEYKFEILWRKQAEELVYRNGGDKSFLTGYENEEEKQYFLEMIRKKREVVKGVQLEEREIFDFKPEEIIKNAKLVERLIILHMNKLPSEYIGLLKAPVFNAYSCNIASNPFDKEAFFTKEGVSTADGAVKMLEFLETGKTAYKADKANYALLKAVIDSGIITDKNISIVECENIYRRFGFECNPIIFDNRIGQQVVKMLWNRIKEIHPQVYEIILDIARESQQNDETMGYRELVINCINCNSQGKQEEDLLMSALSQRSEKQAVSHEEEWFKVARKENIKQLGYLTTDIDLLILLAEEIVERGKYIRTGHLSYKSHLMLTSPRRMAEEAIQDLKRMKDKKEPLSAEDERNLVKIIKFIYSNLKIKSYEEQIEWQEQLPLKDREIKEGDYVELTPYGDSVKPLWEKYHQDLIKIGIRAIKNGQRKSGESPRKN